MSFPVNSLEELISLGKNQVALSTTIVGLEMERNKVVDSMQKLRDRELAIDNGLKFLYSLKKKELD